MTLFAVSAEGAADAAGGSAGETAGGGHVQSELQRGARSGPTAPAHLSLSLIYKLFELLVNKLCVCVCRCSLSCSRCLSGCRWSRSSGSSWTQSCSRSPPSHPSHSVPKFRTTTEPLVFVFRLDRKCWSCSRSWRLLRVLLLRSRLVLIN